jgi:hypothetical protein
MEKYYCDLCLLLYDDIKKCDICGALADNRIFIEVQKQPKQK